MRKFFALLLAILREISDEAPYQRFLRDNNLRHSAQQWRRFTDCRLKAKYARARCC